MSAVDSPDTDHTSLCHLHQGAGRLVACPGGRCAFWEPGGAVLPGRCAVELLDLHGRPEVAEWLLALRTRLEAAETG